MFTQKKPVPHTPNVLWHGSHLDGTLTIFKTPEPFVLSFILESEDLEFSGTFTLKKTYAPQGISITGVMEYIDENYLAFVLKDMKEQIKHGEVRIH